jgi:hypothetical protein
MVFFGKISTFNLKLIYYSKSIKTASGKLLKAIWKIISFSYENEENFFEKSEAEISLCKLEMFRIDS